MYLIYNAIFHLYTRRSLICLWSNFLSQIWILPLASYPCRKSKSNNTCYLVAMSRTGILGPNGTLCHSHPSIEHYVFAGVLCCSRNCIPGYKTIHLQLWRRSQWLPHKKAQLLQWRKLFFSWLLHYLSPIKHLWVKGRKMKHTWLCSSWGICIVL